ncbi:3'(2'),5'-bisphosphate nucleotidase CysQ [Ovoidimarina sediminis]|uniref:3'(2'),5'-bisphosphate nucleotidase CysQ n=1 Tax=Ovoidimarina sediminis TaxID=3079856 RepID=UPI00290BF6B5|nr:3'(2'),5'-bisphosphate nucleotidase CysQ [Rhodophyticola sp. MJ-SS7]MDU8943775.1 3'(2'),5'-bisphosphate nucleotidase CysQ [Rhodophyticola sp. MJ-SS7]
MPAHDLDLLTDAARAAGDIARGFFEGANRVWDKADGGPVGEADIAVDTYLRETLTAARPDYGWLSEETEDDPARLSARRLFVVDPIDGTRAFIAGEATWSHSIAVVEDGVVKAGVVYLPIKDRLFSARLGHGAELNGRPLAASAATRETGARILAARPALDDSHWAGGAPPVHRHFRPSLAYRLSLVGEGRFDGMLTLRDAWEWDIAAGSLIAAEGGAEVTDRTGAALRFNNRHPVTPGVIAAPHALHAALLERLLVRPL